MVEVAIAASRTSFRSPSWLYSLRSSREFCGASTGQSQQDRRVADKPVGLEVTEEEEAGAEEEGTLLGGEDGVLEMDLVADRRLHRHIRKMIPQQIQAPSPAGDRDFGQGWPQVQQALQWPGATGAIARGTTRILTTTAEGLGPAGPRLVAGVRQCLEAIRVLGRAISGRRQGTVAHGTDDISPSQTSQCISLRSRLCWVSMMIAQLAFEREWKDNTEKLNVTSGWVPGGMMVPQTHASERTDRRNELAT